jgi:transposase
MSPLVRRSWSPRGHTPVLPQRTRSHQKVSAIAALCISPGRDRVRLVFRLYPDENIRTRHFTGFLGELLRTLAGPVYLVWDRLPGHRARRVQLYIEDHDALQADYLPAYAPELNPVEHLWGHLKTNALANLAPLELPILARAARSASRTVQHRAALLRAFIHHTPLPLRLK